MTFRRGAIGAALCLPLLIGSLPAAAQFVSLVGGAPPVQSFDTLANTGTSDVLPDGWYLFESDTNANTTYAASDGSSNSGNTYSYGTGSSTERALGMLQSGSLVPMIGAQLRNDAGAALSAILVSYTGEQWRLGAAGRADRLDFQYSLDATSLDDADATWVDVDELDFESPTTGGSTGALDGNGAANRTAVSGTIAGLSLQPSATLWVRWVDADISGAEDGLAIDDVSFATDDTPPVDLPPTVSTTPADGASGVPLGTTLSAVFSEAVDLDAGEVTLACTSSGTHALTVSGGPISFTFGHSPAFVAGETCTWTIPADAVADQDPPADPMAADHVAQFTLTDASGSGPQLIWTLPTQGASDVPRASDLRVIFDTDVTTSAAAFSLSCNGTPIALSENGSGSRRTLTPATWMPVAGSCVFAIDPSGVVGDLGDPMDDPVAIAFTVAPAYNPATYYAPVNTSSPEQLRCSLHQRIRGHVMYPYSGATTNTWTILETAQAWPDDPSKILDVYRNRLYDAVSDRAGTGSGLTYNREHTWPNSLGFPSQTGDLGLPNAPYTDTHMLWLSDTAYNSDRGNVPYANCPSGCSEDPTEVNGGVGGGTGTYPGNSNWVQGPNGNQGSFEVWGFRKGEMARAIFYMAIRYEGGTDPLSGQTEPQLELTDDRSDIVGTSGGTAYMGLLTDLLAWHQADPPDAAEIARNETVQQFQGNRNPFVDHPEWATRALFESGNPPVCEVPTLDLIFADGFESP